MYRPSCDNVGVIILAAGRSARMGKPKQLLKLGGQTFLSRSIDVAKRSEGKCVTVVIGANACDLARNFNDATIPLVFNSKWKEGLSSSIRVGIAALERDCEGDVEAAILMLCDQPFVTSFTLNRLIRAYRESGLPIVASQFYSHGKAHIGVPALFSASLFPELKALSGTGGAKSVISRHRELCAFVNAPEAAIDVDTPQEYRRLGNLMFGGKNVDSDSISAGNPLQTAKSD